MNRKFFERLLLSADPCELAQHSKLNHHVNGMDYLCLHRNDRLTVKLYLIEEPCNPNSGYLVHPHSHRYAFESIMLHGKLEHIRFRVAHAEAEGAWTEHLYKAEHKTLSVSRDVYLKEQIERHREDSTYWVDPHEIHTLRLAAGGPVLIGLVQFEDVIPNSLLYLPKGVKPTWSDERVPTAEETGRLIRRARELMRVA